MWIVTIIGSCIGAFIIIISFILNLAVQKGATAIGISLAVIPYCIARSVTELKKKKNDNKLVNPQTFYQKETKKCPKCAEVVAKRALNCIFCGHKFDWEEILKQDHKRNRLIAEDEYSFDELTE